MLLFKKKAGTLLSEPNEQGFHLVGEEFFFFLKKTLRVSPAYSKEHGRDRDNIKSKRRLIVRQRIDLEP